MLEEKVVMISGVGPGLGREMALGAIREGAKVAIGCRTQSFLEELSKEIKDLGGEVCAVKTDISNSDDTQEFINQTIDQTVKFRHGRIINFKATDTHRALSFNKPYIPRISVQFLGQK